MPEGKHFYEFGPFRLDPAERLLLRNNQTIPLAPKAFETLLLLVENSGHLLTKDELMKRLWPVTFVEEANLAQNISAIRRVLDDKNGEEHYIETVAKGGYRFTGEARKIVREPPKMAAPSPEPTADSAPGLFRRRKSGMRIVVGASATILVIASALFLIPRVVKFLAKGAPAAATAIRSIAVLPLVNLSGDPAQEYFADGMTEQLTTDLGQISALRVISRTSAMRYKGAKKSVPEIARELHVDAVVEGSVERSGDQVRITAQLIDAPDDRHIWAKSYQRDLRDVLALQDEVAATIAKQVNLQLTPEALTAKAKRSLPSFEAQDLYLRARYEWNKRRPENLRRARELFQRVLDLEPNYAAAWAGLADTDYVLVANASGAIPDEGLLRAKAAAQRAIDLDETLGEAHVSLGNVIYAYDRNWPAAEREYKRAIELNASYATAHQLYGIGLSGAGRFDEAIAEERRAVELDPLSPIITNNLERILFFARRYDEAAAVCRKAIAVDQNFNWHHRVLGLALLAQGHNQEALTELRRAHDLAPEFTEALVDLASVYVRLGNQKAALKLLNELQQIAATRYVPPSQFAQMFAYSGQRDLAFKWLDKAVEEERSPQMMQLNVPEWDVLRDDPRFEAVVKRISPRHV